ncbi:43436_t:CDS:2, partial [Gigaspora margarita]
QINPSPIMYPTMALLQQQITGTSQPEKCINKGSNNEIIEKLTGLMEQIAGKSAFSNKNPSSNVIEAYVGKRRKGNLGNYVEVENNAEINEENANKDNKPKKLVKKKRTDITYAQLFQAAPNIRKDISDSEETDNEEEWETEEDKEYQEEHLINKTYLYQEIYDE